MEDPFWRDNEYAARELCEKDCELSCRFTAGEELLARDHVILRFSGIDTLAEVFFNGKSVGYADNMFRTWEYDVKHLLQVGENTIRLHFDSPLRFAREAARRDPVYGVVETTFDGYQHIRKAHCMYGWDWGPQLPDMGLFRPVEIVSWDTACIRDVWVRQKHGDGRVTLTVATEVDQSTDTDLDVSVTVTAPNGESFRAAGRNAVVAIEHPELWWPNGYGSQPLYRVEVELSRRGELLDQRALNVGLRTLTVSTERDRWGSEFCLVANGVKIFGMGADYIPEDNILARVTPERTEALLRDCVAANFNCIRVWGGGYYPDDFFFDLCDRLGLVVWEDFMFACAQYRMTARFEANLREEFIQNIIRMRNHASLGILCGNNEMETAWLNWGIPQNERLKLDYLYLYERMLPDLCEEYAPDTFYWPSSPSSGGGFDDPADENRGDMHCWEIWHGGKPFEFFRSTYFRFCSEFGFEAFPSLKTCESFSLPEDRNPFSLVMESHQKCLGGNRKMLGYMSADYLYPRDFERFIYTSQLSQVDAVRIGVEHWRRNRGRCMGATYWQLNDCWPVASWASIDCYGRWKALQYAAKRFFAPILLSAEEEGCTVTLNLSSERMEDVPCRVEWSVRGSDFTEYASGELNVTAAALSAKDILILDLEEWIKGHERERYLVYTLRDKEGNCLSRQTLLFCKPKHFGFCKPSITAEVSERDGRIAITLRSDCYAKSVGIDFDGVDAVLSDNFFDLADSKPVTVVVERFLGAEAPATELQNALRITSVWDIAG